MLLIELARAHPSVDVRREAIETLGDALPSETVIPVLEELAMKDPDPGIQEEAVDTLAGLEDAKGLATLMALAQSHPRTNVRREAIEALADQSSDPDEARDRTIVDLLEKLARNDRDIEVQLEAVETLGDIPGAAAAGRLRELARTHPDERRPRRSHRVVGQQPPGRRGRVDPRERGARREVAARSGRKPSRRWPGSTTAPASTRCSTSRASIRRRARASMPSRRCSKAIIPAPATSSSARWRSRCVDRRTVESLPGANVLHHRV